MSLVASAGREIDGRTIVMFRRPIQGWCDERDRKVGEKNIRVSKTKIPIKKVLYNKISIAYSPSDSFKK